MILKLCFDKYKKYDIIRCESSQNNIFQGGYLIEVMVEKTVRHTPVKDVDWATGARV